MGKNKIENNIITYYKIVSIFAVVLMEPCLLVDELIVNLGFNLSLGRILIIANLAFIAFSSFNRISLNRLQKSIVAYLVVIAVYLILIGLFIYYGTGFSTSGNIRKIITIILIMIIVNDKYFDIILLKKSFVSLAFIISLLAVFQFIGFILGIIQLELYTFQTYDPGQVVYFNFGGFVDKYSFYGFFYRSQSYWTEPAVFAQFLIIPLFFQGKTLLSERTFNSLFVMLTISAAFLLTFSVANYFGALFGLAMYFIFTKSKSRNKFSPALRIITLTMAGLIIFAIIILFSYTDVNPYGKTTVLGKSTTASIEERYDRLVFAASVLENSFFGDPTIRKNWSRNPTAIGMLVIWGGVPMIVLVFGFVIKYYMALFKRIKLSKNALIYSGSIAYFVGFNWYGSYLDPVFLFQIILFTCLFKYETESESVGNEVSQFSYLR